MGATKGLKEYEFKDRDLSGIYLESTGVGTETNPAPLFIYKADVGSMDPFVFQKDYKQFLLCYFV